MEKELQIYHGQKSAVICVLVFHLYLANFFSIEWIFSNKLFFINVLFKSFPGGTSRKDSNLAWGYNKTCMYFV